MRYEIPVAMLEFDESGHTIWIQGPDGSTILRIKMKDGIEVRPNCDAGIAHADMIGEGRLTICVNNRYVPKNLQ